MENCKRWEWIGAVKFANERGDNVHPMGKKRSFTVFSASFTKELICFCRFQVARALFSILRTVYLYKFILLLIEGQWSLSRKIKKSHLTVRSVKDRSRRSTTGVRRLLSALGIILWNLLRRNRSTLTITVWMEFCHLSHRRAFITWSADTS